VKLAQESVMSDEEHFRFLHNVILPLYSQLRDDLRIFWGFAENDHRK